MGCLLTAITHSYGQRGESADLSEQLQKKGILDKNFRNAFTLSFRYALSYIIC